MNIRGFIDSSFVDWDGKVSCVVFTGGCNLRCRFCYNFGLVLHPREFEEIPEEYILGYLKEHADFIDGVCITGGEPTLQKDLVQFCREVKALGIAVKLDTNGTNPGVLRGLLDEGLVDYVAMDVKAPFDEESYSHLSGVSLKGGLDSIKETIDIILTSGVDHEFRTTVVPGVHTVGDIERISESVIGASRYFLQKFMPHSRLEELNRNRPQTDEEMERFADAARRHLEYVDWRGGR